MRKVKMLFAGVVNGSVEHAGAVVEVDEAVARELIAAGVASGMPTIAPELLPQDRPILRNPDEPGLLRPLARHPRKKSEGDEDE